MRNNAGKQESGVVWRVDVRSLDSYLLLSTDTTQLSRMGEKSLWTRKEKEGPSSLGKTQVVCICTKIQISCDEAYLTRLTLKHTERQTYEKVFVLM